VKEYIAQRSKAFAGGLTAAIASAVTMAVINQAEKAFSFDLGTDVEAYIVGGVIAGVNGVVTAIGVYWAPANKPQEPKS
jgi:hypothetical protein